ncbi:MAG: metal ABC transporter ATP-binding protein [Planctomycetota bacterium]
MLEQREAIAVDGLTVAYHSKPVLWDVSLRVTSGILMGLVGPNGAGKSTLLKAILGLVKPLTGRVLVLDEPFRRERQLVGYVPQRSTIDWDFPTTVLDLVLMGTYGRLGWFGRVGRKQHEAAQIALERVEMQDLQSRQISELSGGQQQRAFLARAFVQDAPILFLDEPFVGVDVKTERSIVKLLHQLRDTGKTVVVVQHDLNTVGEYLDHVTLINRTVISSGPVGEAFTPELIEQAYGEKIV